MSQVPTYYDFLGVSRDAPTEQIRSAYLSLMKQHHPDLSDASDKRRTDDVAALLNLCYDVLKDPEKRARYDGYLTLEARDRARANLRNRALLTGQTYRAKRKRWDASSLVAAVLALMIVATLISLPWWPFGSAAISFQAAPMALRQIVHKEAPRPASYARAEYPGVTAIGPLAVASEARLAMASSSGEAELESRRCFDSARVHSSLAATQMCVVFDDAFVDWSETQSDKSGLSLYFNEPILHVRHKEALAQLGSYQESLLDELREMSLNALLSEVRSKVDGGADSRPSGDSLRQDTGIDSELSR